MQLSNNDNVRAIFGRCLLSCLDVDLWSAYVRFVRKVCTPIKTSAALVMICHVAH